jgi:protein AaeX
MLREVALFGGLAPSLLPYFFAAVLLFLVADQLIARLGVYRLVWNPPLARFGLFLCAFAGLVLLT